MEFTRAKLASLGRLPIVFTLLLTGACASTQTSGLDPNRVSRAITEATALQAQGRKVWCVPFARNASGVQIRGNANTWWHQAEKLDYGRATQPRVGSVMAFSGTRRLPMGHVAVVSKVLSEREIQVDHANWHPSQISMGMYVVDVSEQNDWSAVRLESQPDALGSVYRVDGFILPTRDS